MDWIISLFTNNDSVAHIALLYAIVIAVGVLLGKIKVGGVSLGVTFVLFAGIVAGHVGFTGPTNILTFVQDFGLILFVFCIGLQVGPGFFESFRRGGVTLNLLSTALILLNIAVMFACYFIFFDTSDSHNLPMMVGTLYGAVTNTPGLGAANEALTAIFTKEDMPQIANGYACAYPLGVLGIIGATIAIRYICRVNMKDEDDELSQAEGDNPNAKPCQITVSYTHLDVYKRQLPHNALLGIIGILVLIYQDIAETLHIFLTNILMRLEQLIRQHQQIIKIHGICLSATLHIDIIDAMQFEATALLVTQHQLGVRCITLR